MTLLIWLNEKVLLSACSKIRLWGGDAPTEFYMVERCLAGTTFYFVPACIITSLRDYFRTAVLCRGYTPACILTSRWDYVRTTVLCRGYTPACILSSLWDLLWGGDAPTEFYKVER
ncbi:MAG: hypothetical protein K6D57_03650 [Paludibacteraceae bacterium]|nr:hypothetical protein [Paludibacteraceae bacterium]